MPVYNVTIRATVTKTIQVEAESEDAAAEQAHQEFTVASDRDDERYEQDTVRIEQADS